MHYRHFGPQESFTPSEAQLAWARKIVEAQEHHSAAGTGAFIVDGDMIDMPTVKQVV
jgi:citrate lyase beta subunit